MKKMYVMMVCIAMFGIVFCTSSALADQQPPVEVSAGERYNQYSKVYTPVIQIVANVDKVTITKVELNRDPKSITLPPTSEKPKTVRYGEVFTCYSHKNVKAKELLIETKEYGAWTFTFK